MNAPLRLIHPPQSDDDVRWSAVERRDASADGSFWSCVKTTGVYCLPSCAGRPLRKNVIFVETRAEAEAAGFRPCKRCRPERFVSGALEVDGVDQERRGRMVCEGYYIQGVGHVAYTGNHQKLQRDTHVAGSCPFA